MAMASSDSPSGGDGDRDVFGSLPTTRPQRRSARRGQVGAKARPAAPGPGESGAEATAAAGAPTEPPAARAGAAAPATPAARAGAAAPATPAARTAPAARTKPAARAGGAGRSKPAARTKPAARAGAARAGGAGQAKPAAHSKPGARTKPATTAAPPRPAMSKIPPAGYATPRGDDDVPHGAELVTTAVQAVGELAHIGLAAGGRALKSALGRLPRP